MVKKPKENKVWVNKVDSRIISQPEISKAHSNLIDVGSGDGGFTMEGCPRVPITNFSDALDGHEIDDQSNDGDPKMPNPMEVDERGNAKICKKGRIGFEGD